MFIDGDEIFENFVDEDDDDDEMFENFVNEDDDVSLLEDGEQLWPGDSHSISVATMRLAIQWPLSCRGKAKS